MTSTRSQIKRVLAIVPHSKGLGYAVFEGIKTPIDWGIKRVAGNKNLATLQKVESLIGLFRPDTIVLEEIEGSRRCERIRELLHQIVERAGTLGIEIARFSRKAVSGFLKIDLSVTKHQIACAIAEQLPALRPRLPGPRKPWQSEDYRMTIFEACGLCMTSFHRLHDRHTTR
jgi:hypothetical protein